MPTLRPRRAKAAWLLCMRAGTPRPGAERQLSKRFSGRRELRERETSAGNSSWKRDLERRDVGSNILVTEQRLLADEPADCPLRTLVAARISVAVSGAGCAMAHGIRQDHSPARAR